MKAIVVNKPGGREELKFVDIEKPEIKKGWSLIKVMGFGVNRSEIFTRLGYSPNVKFPRTLGIECVGKIEKSSDKRLCIGQKVVSIMGEMGREFNGSYAEYVLVPNEQIHPIESNLSWEEIASIPETYYTAFGAMNNLKLNEGDSILVRGAASGVGTAFVKLVRAKFPKINIVGSTRNLNKKDKLKKIGYSNIVEEKESKIITKESFDKNLDF